MSSQSPGAAPPDAARLAAAGRHAEALALLDSLPPAQAPREARLLRAKILAQQGHLEDAIAQWREVLAAEPTNREARLGMARAHHLLGGGSYIRSRLVQVVLILAVAGLGAALLLPRRPAETPIPQRDTMELGPQTLATLQRLAEQATAQTTAALQKDVTALRGRLDEMASEQGERLERLDKAAARVDGRIEGIAKQVKDAAFDASALAPLSSRVEAIAKEVKNAAATSQQALSRLAGVQEAVHSLQDPIQKASALAAERIAQLDKRLAAIEKEMAPLAARDNEALQRLARAEQAHDGLQKATSSLGQRVEQYAKDSAGATDRLEKSLDRVAAASGQHKTELARETDTLRSDLVALLQLSADVRELTDACRRLPRGLGIPIFGRGSASDHRKVELDLAVLSGRVDALLAQLAKRGP